MINVGTSFHDCGAKGGEEPWQGLVSRGMEAQFTRNSNRVQKPGQSVGLPLGRLKAAAGFWNVGEQQAEKGLRGVTRPNLGRFKTSVAAAFWCFISMGLKAWRRESFGPGAEQTCCSQGLLQNKRRMEQYFFFFCLVAGLIKFLQKMEQVFSVFGVLAGVLLRASKTFKGSPFY